MTISKVSMPGAVSDTAGLDYVQPGVPSMHQPISTLYSLSVPSTRSKLDHLAAVLGHDNAIVTFHCHLASNDVAPLAKLNNLGSSIRDLLVGVKLQLVIILLCVLVYVHKT